MRALGVDRWLDRVSYEDEDDPECEQCGQALDPPEVELCAGCERQYQEEGEKAEWEEERAYLVATGEIDR